MASEHPTLFKRLRTLWDLSAEPGNGQIVPEPSAETPEHSDPQPPAPEPEAGETTRVLAWTPTELNDLSPLSGLPKPGTTPAKTSETSPPQKPSSAPAQDTVEKAQTPPKTTPEGDMILVNAGEFLMGDDEGSHDEQPQRKVLINTFWIDKYPVTNLD
jgi:formylglycine-generating enzyme required for sulfatase activity